GLKGTKLAVEVLADTAKYIYQNPSVVEKSKRELEERTGDDFNYIPLLGDREPPLNYRDN
ncbi:MAG TPA: amidohydrolase, partial [Gammaproteobacteria bacterium]|nr:amidohydrolase [Gammaproteobacteria bacterium]